MDPVSVIGLVASITRIITFGSEAVKIAAQIRESGSSDRLDRLLTAVDSLSKTTNLISGKTDCPRHWRAPTAKDPAEMTTKKSSSLQSAAPRLARTSPNLPTT